MCRVGLEKKWPREHGHEPGWSDTALRDGNERQMNMAKKLDDPKGAGGPCCYQAYGTDGQRREHLRIWPVAVDRFALAYLDLMNIVFDGHSGTRIELMYSFLRVKIRGHNLQEVVAAIRKETCEFIQEYHPKHFSLPDPDAPMITRIETVMGGEYALLSKKAKIVPLR